MRRGKLTSFFLDMYSAKVVRTLSEIRQAFPQSKLFLYPVRHVKNTIEPLRGRHVSSNIIPTLSTT